MPKKHLIRVLVVDDSPMVRRHLCAVFNEAGMITETAANGRECLVKIAQFKPTVVTLDINMPVMDGIECLKRIMQRHAMPVVMISSLTKSNAAITLNALELGAVDYIPKPEGGTPSAMANSKRMLVSKVFNASRAKLPNVTPSILRQPKAPIDARSAFSSERSIASTPAKSHSQKQLVIVGVSTGGPVTLQNIIPLLPANYALPIVIAQHMPARFTGVFAERLNKLSAIRVEEISGATALKAGNVYVAQGDSNIEIYKQGGALYARPNNEESEHIWRPSITHLVESALKALPAPKLCCVQLTGMGNDGASAMAKAMHQGAFTIAESEETSQVYGMPKALVKLNGASKTLPDYEIAKALMALNTPNRLDARAY